MMSAFELETIAARATPPGQGGVGIIRISGPKATTILKAIFGHIPKHRMAAFGQFKSIDERVIDEGLALYFKAPHSFTGEDVVELQGHGGPVVMDMLLQAVVKQGARLARPGEFSERAFLNNKIDLIQAEAIADLIQASSEQAARSAIQSLQGKFSEEINRLLQQITYLRMYVEAAIDFPDEEIDFLTDGKVLHQLKEVMTQLAIVLQQAQQGSALNEGMKVVIAGYPNAGKSSLLNSLSGQETAIVSDIPGTTRDVVKEKLIIDGLPIHICDTAGLRLSDDSIEAEGVRRAWREIPNADRILLVVDAKQTSMAEIAQHQLVQQFSAHSSRLTVIRNKVDLLDEDEQLSVIDDDTMCILNLSVKTGLGMDNLKQHLKSCAGLQTGEETFMARRRHMDALNRANQSLLEALEQLVTYQASELVAEELRQAQNAMAEITGEFRSDDLLGKIFSTFCIGK